MIKKNPQIHIDKKFKIILKYIKYIFEGLLHALGKFKKKEEKSDKVMTIENSPPPPHTQKRNQVSIKVTRINLLFLRDKLFTKF